MLNVSCVLLKSLNVTTEGLNEIAELVQEGVTARYYEGFSMLTMKALELPAEILVFPVTFTEKSRSLRVGHIWLFDRVWAKTLFPLKSNNENSNTGVTVQSIDLFGFLKLKATVNVVNVSWEVKAL